jgi:hypothetical protein
MRCRGSNEALKYGVVVVIREKPSDDDSNGTERKTHSFTCS